MWDAHIETLLNICANYAIRNSSSDETECCHIGELYDVLNEKSPRLMQYLEDEFQSVTLFLKYVRNNDYFYDRFRNRHDRDFEVMRQWEYNSDNRNFSALNYYRRGSSYMLVLIPCEEPGIDLEEELYDLYRVNKLLFSF